MHEGSNPSGSTKFKKTIMKKNTMIALAIAVTLLASCQEQPATTPTVTVVTDSSLITTDTAAVKTVTPTDTTVAK